MAVEEIQLIMVVESKDTAKTDDAYYAWILKNHYPELISRQGTNGLRIKYDFLYMDGKTNYTSSRIKRQIQEYKGNYKGKTFVLYCFDLDTKGKEDLLFIQKAKGYAVENNRYISVANDEIETVMKVGHKELNKREI